RAACEHLKARETGPADELDRERALDVIDRYSTAYRERVVEIAPLVNQMARHVPARRSRKLHVGLFGYARELSGVTLPRAIGFTCALHSLGLPPEIIAFDALNADDLAYVMHVYPSLGSKLADAMLYTDPNGPLMTSSLRCALESAGFGASADERYLEIVRRIRSDLERGETAQTGDLVVRAALIRRFLG
ncbi:MAG TPA: phosphoenolpyruvate carboxylase, partial [Actinobacteria bacterium]|nr:phosphoenolpyruvate carboxylase [Actinomycetota bacterium]